MAGTGSGPNYSQMAHQETGIVFINPQKKVSISIFVCVKYILALFWVDMLVLSKICLFLIFVASSEASLTIKLVLHPMDSGGGLSRSAGVLLG